MGKKDKNNKSKAKKDDLRGGPVHDKTYEGYLAMIKRNNFGAPMTRKQWEGARDSEA